MYIKASSWSGQVKSRPLLIFIYALMLDLETTKINPMNILHQITCTFAIHNTLVTHLM